MARPKQIKWSSHIKIIIIDHAGALPKDIVQHQKLQNILYLQRIVSTQIYVLESKHM